MTNAPHSILVIIVARIGDTLLITPGLRALKIRWPNAHLTVAAHPNRRELLDGLPFIDRVLSMNKRRAPWLGHFPGHRWDLALVYGEDRPLLHYALRVSRRVIAFEQHDAVINARLSTAVAKPTQAMHAVDERSLLLAPLDIAVNSRKLAYQTLAHERETAQNWLQDRLPGTGPVFGLQPCSFPSKAYRDWPEAHFITVAEHLLRRYPTVRIVVLGGQEGRTVADRVAEKLGARAISSAGQLRLRESAALISLLDLYVGVDTGPTHIAGALDVPMVGLYHCHHPGRYLQPLEHSNGIFIEHPATDSGCPRDHSMDAINLATVERAIDTVLDNAGFAPAA
ncbi:MAG: glycosyltransferase family 9 protein [Gammaproteobacteria bacterium]|nr:glycosyltransferase family 9 protein [Gammaproteobacteria bacterium]